MFFFQNLLSKWTKTSLRNHITVNERNRCVFLEAIDFKNSFDTSDTTFRDSTRDILTEKPNENIWDDIFQHLKISSEINSDIDACSGIFYSRTVIKILNTQFLGLIQELDVSYLRNISFDYCPSKINVKKNCFEDSFNKLKELTGTVERAAVVRGVNVSKNVLLQRDLHPSVGLGYALLNLERNDLNFRLLRQVLEEIAGKQLSEVERGFIQYFWDNFEGIRFF